MSSGITKVNRHASRQLATPPWLWLLLVAGAYLIFWEFVPKRDGPNPSPVLTPRTWLLLFVLALVVWILAFTIRFFRTFDPGVRRANKRAQAGDLAGGDRSHARAN